MHIVDKYDQHIIVTDLAAAIKQAELFKHYRHKDSKSGIRDDELKTYWSDVHTKLLGLQAKLSCNSVDK